MQSLNHLHDSSAWCFHFEQNQTDLSKFPWARTPRLAATEVDDIAGSIAEFQRGESSEGRHFKQVAAEFAQTLSDPSFLRATELFIDEENRHGEMLSRFLRHEGQELTSTTTADSIFRKLRSLGGLEGCITVLVTAEIIAQVYYPALHDATESALLRKICEQIIADEEHHIRFQAERIALFQIPRSPFARKLGAMVHASLMVGAATVVWWNHRRVFQRAQMGLFSYASECAQRFREARRQINAVVLQHAMLASGSPLVEAQAP